MAGRSSAQVCFLSNLQSEIAIVPEVSMKTITIDRNAGVARWVYPGWKTEEYPLSADWIARYANCRTCGKPLDDDTFARALDQAEQKNCSSECIKAADKKRYACCEKAELCNCVCFISFQCPEHGKTCVGSHD